MDENNKNQETLEENASVPEEEIPGAQEVKEELPAPKPQKTREGSGRLKRSGMATMMTVVFIAIVVVLNLLVSILSDRFPSMNIDLTAQGMNTLSEQALEIAKGVTQPTEIYLIGAEDGYRSDAIGSSYGLKYSQVANLAERLEEANGKIHTQFIDPDLNPNFISEYPNESLSTGMVMVKTDRRYKVLGMTDMFSRTQNSTTGAIESYSNVDSALAGALELVNMEKVPVLTLATGHNELLNSSNMSAFLSMMERQNFEVREIDLLTEEIPEDTQILMIPTPTTDYTDEELEKLRALLADGERKESIAVLAAFYPGQGELPKLSSFLEEWGVKVHSGAVVAETDDSRYILGSPNYPIVDKSEEVLKDKTYNRLISPMSVPLELMFSGNGDVGTQALWTTADSAYELTEENAEQDPQGQSTSQQTVATLSSVLQQFDNEFYYRSVIVYGSSFVFVDDFMQTAFGNSEYLSDLMKYATDTDGSEVSVLTERVQTNILDITASQGTIVMLGLGVFTVGLPVVILAMGLVIFLKRRHL